MDGKGRNRKGKERTVKKRKGWGGGWGRVQEQPYAKKGWVGQEGVPPGASPRRSLMQWSTHRPRASTGEASAPAARSLLTASCRNGLGWDGRRQDMIGSRAEQVRSDT